jgi:hypothetical protein
MKPKKVKINKKTYNYYTIYCYLSKKEYDKVEKRSKELCMPNSRTYIKSLIKEDIDSAESA